MWHLKSKPSIDDMLQIPYVQFNTCLNHCNSHMAVDVSGEGWGVI